jgi:hypothetical protein
MRDKICAGLAYSRLSVNGSVTPHRQHHLFMNSLQVTVGILAFAQTLDQNGFLLVNFLLDNLTFFSPSAYL